MKTILLIPDPDYAAPPLERALALPVGGLARRFAVRAWAPGAPAPLSGRAILIGRAVRDALGLEGLPPATWVNHWRDGRTQCEIAWLPAPDTGWWLSPETRELAVDFLLAELCVARREA